MNATAVAHIVRHDDDDLTDVGDFGDLEDIVAEFSRLGRYSHIEETEGIHLAITLTHRMLAAIVRLEGSGQSRETVLERLQPVRDLHAESPFVRRLQQWPRGYPGDFETVEYLLCQRNLATTGRLSYFLEQYALGSPIAQQHRNKVEVQARAVLDMVRARAGVEGARVLMLAAGGSPDLRRVQPLLADYPFEATLVDQDPDALTFSRERLPLINDRLTPVCANVIRGLQSVARKGPFDLVVAGGLFDYLPDRVAISVLHQARCRLLRTDGQMFFTNIGCSNVYQPWIEHMANWFLIHRSEADIRNLCASAGWDEDAVRVETDPTGLAFLATCGPAPSGR